MREEPGGAASGGGGRERPPGPLAGRQGATGGGGLGGTAAGWDRATSRRRRYRITAVAAGAVALAVLAAVLIMRPSDGSGPPPSDDLAASPSPARHASGRFFADDDPMNVRHPAAREAAGSDAMVKGLLSAGRAQLYAGDAGLPVYHATPHTPTYRVTPREHVKEWGDPLSEVRVPWDASWQTRHDDARIWSVVVAPGGRSVECRQLLVHGGRPSCGWGAVTDLTRSSAALTGAPTGSGLSRLAGLITRDDWEAGRIDHALAFGTRNAPGHVYPARRDDGKSSTARWHEGQYIWLDPSYDVEHDSSLKPYERIVARALQEYGAYDVRNYEGGLAFTAEFGVTPPGSDAASYAPLTDIDFTKYLHVGTVDRPR